LLTQRLKYYKKEIHVTSYGKEMICEEFTCRYYCGITFRESKLQSFIVKLKEFSTAFRIFIRDNYNANAKCNNSIFIKELFSFSRIEIKSKFIITLRNLGRL
jgi:hypothetical protein